MLCYYRLLFFHLSMGFRQHSRDRTKSHSFFFVGFKRGWKVRLSILCRKAYYLTGMRTSYGLTKERWKQKVKHDRQRFVYLYRPIWRKKKTFHASVFDRICNSKRWILLGTCRTWGRVREKIQRKKKSGNVDPHVYCLGADSNPIRSMRYLCLSLSHSRSKRLHRDRFED